jgi:hypothetical protein
MSEEKPPRLCINCGQDISKTGGHFVPPGGGDPGFFSCKPKDGCRTCRGKKMIENSSSGIFDGGPEMVPCPTCSSKPFRDEEAEDEMEDDFEDDLPDGMRFEIFLTKLNHLGKTGIRLPRREEDSKEEKDCLHKLLESGMISELTYSKRVMDIDSVTLDDEMYEEFWKTCKRRGKSKEVKTIEKITHKHILCVIQLFHEVMSEEFPGSVKDHPRMDLYDDGSGYIVSMATKRYNGEKYPNGILFSFHSIEELVRKADELTDKHGKEWRKYVNEE